MRELLIVGIDPGTTAGYAVLDTNGNVLKTRSSKLLELNSLIESIVKLGSVLAVGTDKKKCPQLIEKAAAKTGARIITPREDLAVSEKNMLTQGTETANSHEKDALAAAMYAYRELEPLLTRIKKSLAEEGKQHRFMDVTELVIMTGINIKEALRQAEERAMEPLLKKHEEAGETNAEMAADAAENGKERFQNLLLRKAEKENAILRSYNAKLIGRLRLARKELRKTEEAKASEERRASQPAIEEREKHRSELVAKMQAVISGKEKQVKMLMEEKDMLNTMIAAAASGRYIVAKKLGTLGLDELEHKMPRLGILENEVMLVDNPEVYSEKALDKLQEKGITLLSRKRPGSNMMLVLRRAGIIPIYAEHITAQESENFALISKEQLDSLKKKASEADVLKAIENYKEERKTQLKISAQSGKFLG